MKKSYSATSIIEAMVVLLVVVTGIVWVYNIMSSSQNLAKSTSDRIEAINIARDGLEAFTNIRDTNWLLFAADYENCWNTLNYNSNCIWEPGSSTDILPGSYRIYKNASGQFILSAATSWVYSDSSYRSDFEVFLDANGFYSQLSGSTKRPLFTRELQIQYLQADDSSGISNDPKIRATAIVQWNNSSKESSERLEMDVLLSNWKVDL